jgi:Superinfection immunity protein
MVHAFLAQSSENTAAGAGAGIILMLIAFGFYFLPTFIAAGRHHHNTGAIFIIDLLLGWTLLGWAVALAWAFTNAAPAPAATTIYIQKPDGTLEVAPKPVAVEPKKVPPQIFRL